MKQINKTYKQIRVKTSWTIKIKRDERRGRGDSSRPYETQEPGPHYQPITVHNRESVYTLFPRAINCRSYPRRVVEEGAGVYHHFHKRQPYWHFHEFVRRSKNFRVGVDEWETTTALSVFGKLRVTESLVLGNFTRRKTSFISKQKSRLCYCFPFCFLRDIFSIREMRLKFVCK